MKTYAISQVRRAVRKMAQEPSHCLLTIGTTLDGDDVQDSTIAVLTLLKKHLTSRMAATRSELTLPMLILEGFSLLRLEILQPEIDTFYCTLEEAHILGRIILWETRKMVACAIANPTIDQSERERFLVIRNQSGLDR